MPLQTLTEKLKQRVWAGILYYKYDSNIYQAAAAFKRKFKRQHLPANLHQFISQWAKSLVTTGCVYDADRPGRPTKLPDADAEECALLIGSDKYHTINEAISNCPKIQEIINRSRVGLSTFRRRIHIVDPVLSKSHKPRAKRALNTREKRERREDAATCLQAVKNDPNILDRVVWVDQKTINLVKGKAYSWRWGHTGFKNEKALRVVCPRLKKSIKLHYYAGVNAKVGPVFLKFTSGTTGLRTKKEQDKYKVSTYLEQYLGVTWVSLGLLNM